MGEADVARIVELPVEDRKIYLAGMQSALIADGIGHIVPRLCGSLAGVEKSVRDLRRALEYAERALTIRRTYNDGRNGKGVQ